MKNLTPAQIRVVNDTLKRITYKPRSRIEFTAGCLVLHTIEYVLGDALGGRRSFPWTHEDFEHRVTEIFTAGEGNVSVAEATILAFREVVMAEERHEADEWIMVDGKQIFDPHDFSTADVTHMRSLVRQFSDEKVE